VKLKVEFDRQWALLALPMEHIREESSKREERREENEEIQERGSWSRNPANDETLQSRSMDKTWHRDS
jgi:hypothetical protein